MECAELNFQCRYSSTFICDKVSRPLLTSYVTLMLCSTIKLTKSYRISPKPLEFKRISSNYDCIILYKARKFL